MAHLEVAHQNRLSRNARQAVYIAIRADACDLSAGVCNPWRTRAARSSLLSEEPYLRVKLNIKLALDLGLNVLDNRMNLSSGSVVVVDHKASMLIGNTSAAKAIALKTSIGNKFAYKVTLRTLEG